MHYHTWVRRSHQEKSSLWHLPSLFYFSALYRLWTTVAVFSLPIPESSLLIYLVVTGDLEELLLKLIPVTCVLKMLRIPSRVLLNTDAILSCLPFCFHLIPLTSVFRSFSKCTSVSSPAFYPHSHCLVQVLSSLL